MMDTNSTEPPIDSIQEVVDPLASSGLSLSSNEDGLPRRNNRKQSMLSRLRKLKHPETNGQVNGITPHPPPDKSVQNSIGNDMQSVVIPSGAHHLQNRVESPTKEEHVFSDPFPGEGIKTCEMVDSVAPIQVESFSSKPGNRVSIQKFDPFTGKIVRNKKKAVPSHRNISPESIEDKEMDVKVDSFTGEKGAPLMNRDPFTAISSVDCESPTEELNKNVCTAKLSKVKSNTRCRLNAPSSNDRDNFPKELHVNNYKSSRELVKMNTGTKDRFTAVTDCENKDTFHGEQGKIRGLMSNQYDPSAKNQTSALLMRRLNTSKQNKTCSPTNRQFIDADAETGECMQGDTGANAESHDSDHVNNACATPQELNVKSLDAEVNLSGSHNLLNSTGADTKLNHGEPSLLQPNRQERLSPLIEQPSQELKDDQVEETVIKNVTEVENSRSVLNTDNVTGNKKHVDESDSDDLVVMPDNTGKSFPVFIEKHSNPEINRRAEDPAVLGEKLVSTSTSTTNNSGCQKVADLSPGVPPLNLKGIISDEESLDDDSGSVSEGNRTTDPNQQNEVEVVARRARFNRENEGVASGSDLSSIESDSMDEKKDSVARHADVLETESKTTMCRENRTRNIQGVGISLSKSAGVLDSSDMVQRGKLSPVTPKKHPPQLEENFSSLLRTSSKKNNMSRSMVSSEPLLRSTEELSDTNRSFLSTGALPPISTKKARTRSFLSGGMRNTGSLLGREELERFFPDRKLTIFVVTWNMCERKILPENLEDLLLPEHAEFDSVQDMYVIGTQESSPDGSEWQISLQETLGPSHVLLHTATHGVLRLLIFLRRDLIWFCSPVEEDQVSTRPGSMIKTKGAVAASFTFFGTSFLFINSHFTSGDENMKDRLLDYDKICKGLQLPVKVELTKRYNVLKADVTTRFDCIFWFGDFNFRLVESRKKMENWANQLRDGTKTDYSILLENDQLLKAMNKKEIFKGFQEGPIEFVPTYKYDIGNDTYDTSEKQRVPSYTDRVLFKSRKKNDITVLHYMTCDNIKASDHRPVYGVYQVNIRPGKEDMLLGGGQFHRDVFIEANKRRAEQAGMTVTLRSQQASSVCVVM